MMQYLNLTVTLHQDKPNLRDILYTGLNLPKCQGHESQGKAEDLYQTKGD